MRHPLVQLILLTTAMAAAGFSRTSVSPLQEAMRMALALSDNQIAILQGPIIGVPIAFAAIPFGILIDRTSRVRLLLILVALTTIGSFLTAYASSFGSLLLVRALSGVTALTILPVVFSLLADLYPPEKRGRVLTVSIIGQVAGNSVAFAIGGELLGLANNTGDAWRWAMLWMSVPLVVVALLMLALREPPRSGASVARPTTAQGIGELRHYLPLIVPIAIGVICAEIAVGALLIWAAPTLSRNFGLAPTRVGSIMAVGVLLSGLAGPLVGGPLADYCQRTGGPRRTLAALTVLSIAAAAASLFAYVPDIISASILLVASMTFALASAIMGMTLFTIVIPNKLRGLCMSILVAAELLFALAVAPPLVSLLANVLGGPSGIGEALSIVCTASAFAAAVTFVLGRRNLARTMRAVNA